MRARALVRVDRQREAVEDFDRAFDAGYVTAGDLNAAAWLRANSPDPGARDAAKAERFAWQAVRAVPEDGSFWNTWGVTQCRLDQWQRALGSLTRSMDLRDGGDAFDWYFVAMAHARLGHADEARTWFDKAAAWRSGHAPADEELARFAAEAAEAVGAR